MLIRRARRNRLDQIHSSCVKSRGQALVEFALVTPLFLCLVMAIIDFGWAFRGYITTTNAAREGARLGITGATAEDIELITLARSGGILEAGDVSVTNAQGKAGENVTVAISYDYNYLTPLGSLFRLLTLGTLPNPLPISASTTMRLE